MYVCMYVCIIYIYTYMYIYIYKDGDIGLQSGVDVVMKARPQNIKRSILCLQYHAAPGSVAALSPKDAAGRWSLGPPSQFLLRASKYTASYFPGSMFADVCEENPPKTQEIQEVRRCSLSSSFGCPSKGDSMFGKGVPFRSGKASRATEAGLQRPLPRRCR